MHGKNIYENQTKTLLSINARYDISYFRKLKRIKLKQGTNKHIYKYISYFNIQDNNMIAVL